ncbi:MAG: hypothetical protein EPO12_08275 [Aquabacterium sp.]|nr:MAG: hypothetical protein EPO12_08275 [Aquabacterium sp.]
MRAGGGGPLLAFHDLDWHLGSGFSWENAPGAGRRPNGGANGDDGLCEGDLYSLWSTGIDAAREASGVDYLLPTALLAYRKGGAYQAEVRSGSRLAVPRLPVSAWTPARAWASGYDTPCQRTARKVPPNRQTATSTLGARLATGEALYKNQYLRSADGRHELILQRDGNLVLYRLYGSSARAAVWATGTSAGAMLVMQGDGNLVLYDSSVFNAQLPLHAVWASGTDGRPDAHLLLQSDGNAVLYRQAGEVTWATGTNER